MKNLRYISLNVETSTAIKLCPGALSEIQLKTDSRSRCTAGLSRSQNVKQKEKEK